MGYLVSRGGSLRQTSSQRPTKVTATIVYDALSIVSVEESATPSVSGDEMETGGKMYWEAEGTSGTSEVASSVSSSEIPREDSSFTSARPST